MGLAGRVDLVLVCGGRWHDFDHARLEILQALSTHEQVRTRVFEDYRDLEAIRAADVLVTYTCDVRPDPEQAAALVDFVARGGRWLALHATNAAIDPPTPTESRFTAVDVLGEVAPLLGSRFLGHPPIEPHEISVTDPTHPLVAGIEPFTVSDELYVSELYGTSEVLLHVDFDGASPGFVDAEPRQSRQPVLYLRGHGEGEICYFTLGHCRGRFDIQDLGVEDLGVTDRGSWDSPEFREILARCIAWALL